MWSREASHTSPEHSSDLDLRTGGGTDDGMSKYKPAEMIGPLRLFAEARRQALEAGFTDNGGAIHSVERILDILAQRLCYPFISHVNNLKSHPEAECSVGAVETRASRGRLYIEHVMPQREYARQICDMIEAGATDAALLEHIAETYRLVILNEEETRKLNLQNRSRLSHDRIADAGISIGTGSR
jgi:hypothetical protein